MADPFAAFPIIQQGGVDPFAAFPIVQSAPQESVGNIAAGAEGLAQGATFGTSDEIEGAARALYGKVTGDGAKSFRELYDEAVAIPRQRQKRAADSNPIAYYGGELAGGVALPGGLARAGVKGAMAAAANRGLMARSVAGAKEGAAYGALYGAGKAEGGVEDRLTGAAGGAAGGAVVGAALPAVVDVAGSAVTRAVAPFRGAVQPKEFAAEKFGEAIARDLSTDSAAATGREGERFAAKFATMADNNPSVVAMDAGGENVRNLMRAGANMASSGANTAKRLVDARQANQHARITDDLAQGFGERRNFYESVDMLAERMDKIGATVIAPALKKETPITPRLASVLDRPTMRELSDVVARKLQDEGRAVGFETRTEMIHRMKMELDEQIGMAVKAERMGNKPQAGWDKGTLVKLKNDLLNAVDNPTYKAGLKQYSSQARLQNAAEDGFEAFNKSAPEELRATLNALDNEVERDFFRMGTMRAVVDRVRKGNANNDRTDGVFSSPEMQLKLRAVMPNQKAYREFQKDLIIEAKMADSRKALQGNSTTAKQLMQADQAGKTSRLVTSAMNATSGRLEPVLNLLSQGANRFSGITPAVANQLLTLGMSREPGLINALAQRGVEAAARTPVTRANIASRVSSGRNALMTDDEKRQ